MSPTFGLRVLGSSACSNRQDSLQSSPAGISPSKTGVNALMTRGSIFFARRWIAGSSRVKPGNDAEVDQFDREPSLAASVPARTSLGRDEQLVAYGTSTAAPCIRPSRKSARASFAEASG